MQPESIIAAGIAQLAAARQKRQQELDEADAPRKKREQEVEENWQRELKAHRAQKIRDMVGYAALVNGILLGEDNPKGCLQELAQPKHGNRALSSQSGAADVLSALGIKIDLEPVAISRCIKEAGIGFMFAPMHHPAMKHVGPTRVELGTRTIFNLLGPLSNPANVKRQMVGVFARSWVEPLAKVLAALGSERAWVVHGSDGLDEITTTGPTFVAELDGEKIRTFTISPEEVGLKKAAAAELKGGEAAHNAAALIAVLQGKKGPYRDVAIFNAAAALVVAGKSDKIADAMKLAEKSIESGGAKTRFEKLIAVSNA
jgi:anthranilate phosphoribosyltransferase